MSKSATNSTDEEDSLPSVQFPQQPKPHGKIHPKLQLVESPVHDILSLREYLGTEDDPLCNWNSERLDNCDNCHENMNNSVSEADPSSWIPCDDKVALYAPTKENPQKYETLSYAELHNEIQKCPSFVVNEEATNDSGQPARVAIVIPAEQMADYAVALLGVLFNNAVAVPLDPRMPLLRVLDAMEHQECTCLISTEEWLLQNNVLEHDNSQETTLYRTHSSLSEINESDDMTSQELKAYFREKVGQIRLATPNDDKGGCGRMDWVLLARNQETNKAGVWHQESISSQNSIQLKTSGSDLALLLRTSGTTSKPKVVPISKSRILYMSLSLAAALGLKRDDCCANALPMYHIGGIACNLLGVLLSGGSVLMAGPLQDPNVFLDHLLTDKSSISNHNNKKPAITWYYAGPPMHKAIVLMAEARYNANKQVALPSQLRFIRNAQAHINHDLVLQLSKVFGCPVIPTYAMTEAMPISFSAPIDIRYDPPTPVIDSVGFPLCDLRVVHPGTEKILEYNSSEALDDDDGMLIGEVCVKGPGVISEYLGVDPTTTHTSDGWLRTGDKGYLDSQGRLFLKGRIKEMIKRGGEQVWPNEIDDVVEKVPGVTLAVTFGVPNELWGEEVAVAVVLDDAKLSDNPSYLDQLTKDILKKCKAKLDDISIPKQIKFLATIEELPAGSELWTKGKYVRSRMADHLGVTAVDTGALRSLTMASQIQAKTLANQDTSDYDSDLSLWDKCLVLLETTHKDGKRVIPSDALNGVRFLVTCFVVQVHVGLFPNLPWIKLQGYPPNMMIFFTIAGFQTTCQVARSVKGQWAHFVGTKIGALHALYVICQFITFPSYVLFRAFDENGNLIWNTGDWVKNIVWFIFTTVTGMGHKWNINMFTWFQSTYYLFLALFPFLDNSLRYQTLKRQCIVFVVSALLAAALWALLFISIPADVFWGGLYPLGWTIVTWLPLLVASMCAAYFFRRLIEYYSKQKEKEMTISERQQYLDSNPGSIDAEQVVSHTKVWGRICDATSLVLLIAWILVAVVPDCLCVFADTFEEMRPEDPIPEPGCPPFRNGLTDYVWACDITYNEFVGNIQPDPNHFEFGRFVTNYSGAFGYFRCSAPIFLLWCATMAFGTGYTSRLFSSKLFHALAPLGYPVYLVHMAIVRYYWVATRGLERQYWWGREGEFPVPIEWWEFFLILIVSIVIGGLINMFVVPPLLPYTISWGVKVCSWISHTGSRFAVCCFGDSALHNDGYQTKYDNMEEESKTYKELKVMIRGLTGIEEVTSDLPLQHLGLDSLGATALLGTIRSTVPAARNLTLKQLQECETVGELHDFLNGANDAIKLVPTDTESFQS